MKQTLEEAAKEHQNGFPTCEDDSICAGFINGRRHQCYKSFIAGAKWQSKQSPWISVKDRLPRTDDDLYLSLIHISPCSLRYWYADRGCGESQSYAGVVYYRCPYHLYFMFCND